MRLVIIAGLFLSGMFVGVLMESNTSQDFWHGLAAGDLGKTSLAISVRSDVGWSGLHPNVQWNVERTMNDGVRSLVKMRQAGTFPEDACGSALDGILRRYEALGIVSADARDDGKSNGQEETK